MGSPLRPLFTDCSFRFKYNYYRRYSTLKIVLLFRSFDDILAAPLRDCFNGQSPNISFNRKVK